MTPAQLQHAARQLSGTENALGWAKADLCERAKRLGVPEWYVICAREFGHHPRYCFALAKTAEFYAVIRTMTGWWRNSLEFSAWAAASAYWGRDGVGVEVLIDVMAEAIGVPMSVSDFESMLYGAFGERDPKPYMAQAVAYSKNLYSWAETLGKNHKHYAPLMKAAEILKGLNG